MKIVIDVPEARYKDIQRIAEVQHDSRHFSTAEQIIAKGIPLEQEPILGKIRAEVEQTAKDYDEFDDYRRVRGLWIALEIIDKCNAESEE